MADLFGPQSIRFRITLVATVAVALVLVVGSMALVRLQQESLIRSMDETLATTWEGIAADVASGEPLDGELDLVSDGFAQLVGPSGTVVASTPNLSAAPAMPVRVDAGGEVVLSTRDGLGLGLDSGEVRVLSRTLASQGTLHVGMSAEIIAESADALVRALLAIVPLLVAALAIVVWWLVGRTLRPVEAIRAEVSAIGATELDRRVPVPRSDDEIARLAGTMNAMLERVEASVERQRTFVGDASHELRGPLTRMRSSIEVELAHPRDPGPSKVLDSVLEDVVDLQHLVDDLLWLARADAGSMGLDRRPVDLEDVVLREAAGARAAGRVAVDTVGVAPTQVSGDPAQLARVVRNLMDNAARYATSRIQVRLEAEGSDAVLTVADDGPGVPPQEQERIFERFGRLDPARSSESGGTGLGLAIARGIAERHGGSLVLLAADGPGATFELRLPRVGD